MRQTEQENFEISIFVPPEGVPNSLQDDPSVELHSIKDWMPTISKVSKVSAAELHEQWARTIDTLMSLSSTIADRSKDWSIDEIEVGLTLSAKGELLFIAEAGAEASIKFKLKRKSAQKSKVRA